jgi:hypothetical protein
MNDGLGGDFGRSPNESPAPAARSLPRRRNFWNIQIASQIGTMDLEAATSGARAAIPSRVQDHYLVAGTYGHPER